MGGILNSNHNTHMYCEIQTRQNETKRKLRDGDRDGARGRNTRAMQQKKKKRVTGSETKRQHGRVKSCMM